MNILDENIIASQRQRLRSWRIPVRQIGVDIARKGLQDEEILPFLHHLRRPTFFTRDRGFYRREVCHRQYSLVCLEVAPEEVAIFVRRILRPPRLNTQVKRMGTVVRASHRGLAFWGRFFRRHMLWRRSDIGAFGRWTVGHGSGERRPGAVGCGEQRRPDQ